jgi:hypothetical protein
MLARSRRISADTLRTAAISLGLFALNFYIARELFLTEYTARMGSIEAAYIGISRYILEHGLHLDWFPLWYCGVPFQNTYPPLLHTLVALDAWVLHISPALSHHFVCAIFYCLGPATLYFLAQRLSSNWIAGAIAALAYSLVAPSTAISTGVASWATLRDPARYFSLYKFGDGPHVSSLTLLPLAILALDWAIKNGGAARICLAALSFVAVALTNWLGAFALAIAVASYLLALAAREGKWLLAALETCGTAALSYGIAMPWLPPSTIATIAQNAPYVEGRYELSAGTLWAAAGLLALAALLFYVLRRSRAGILFGFASFFSLFTTALLVLFERFGIPLVPQPIRFHLEMDLGLCLLFGCASAALWKITGRKAQVAILIGAALLAAWQLKNVRHSARQNFQPIDISRTIEYESAMWMRDHLSGRRAYALGSTQFWLNAFTDIPQVGGGFAQGVVNSHLPVVLYGIPWTVKDGAATAAWLKLYGAAAVAVSDPLTGRDVYRDGWKDATKFQGVLREEFRDGGDAIYSIPTDHYSLAHVIDKSDIVTRTPVNNFDTELVRNLAEALDNSALPHAEMTWQGANRATIRSTLRPDQVLFVQISYHPGWHAAVGGVARPIRSDGLGLTIVEPQCSGACEVQLIYDGSREMKAALWISRLSLFGGVLWIGFSAGQKLAARRRR